jgi:signal transduction histidine kinase
MIHMMLCLVSLSLYSTKSFGVGLGLPVVQGIIKQHRGKIEVNSKVGAGTQVVVWLPLP